MSPDEVKYRYAGLPLTPTVAEELIIQLFAGKTARRQVIVDQVAATHEARGGGKARAADLSRVVKKALEQLADSKAASNPSAGHWRIGLHDPDTPHDDTLLESPQPNVGDIVGRPKRTVGDGSQSVYLYYFPSYRELATLKAEERWPCKIGRSVVDPLVRIMSQGTTALPERPCVELMMLTSDSLALESTIHGLLALRGHRLDSSPGSEWFRTSPDEVVGIQDMICKQT